MIEIPHETCAGCQRCCHGTPGNHIPAKLPADSPLRYDKNHRCERLNTRNMCNLGPRKPIECQMYPIVIVGGDVYVDMSCPAWKLAVEQWCARFGGVIDDYEPGEGHKFVNLWMAKMLREDKQ